MKQTSVHSPSLSREIASLTASLHRETQRRLAIAAHAKEQEVVIAELKQQLCASQYANKKLEHEIEKASSSRETQHQHLIYEENARLIAENERLQHQLQETVQKNTPRSAARDHEHGHNHIPDDAQQKPPSPPPPSVEKEIEKLHAVVPQYRAAATALQSHASLLQTQLAAVTQERDQLQKEVQKWQESAQKLESLCSDVTSKLHSQEASTLASTTTRRALTEQLKVEAATWHQKWKESEKKAEEYLAQAQRAQRDNDTHNQIIAKQRQTIAHLEHSVREQQEDIIAALDLVNYSRDISAIQNEEKKENAQHVLHKNMESRQDKGSSEWKIPAAIVHQQKSKEEDTHNKKAYDQLADDINILQCALKEIMQQ